VTNSTFSSNSAFLSGGGGGGISNWSGTLTVRNSTISGNTTPAGNGGGIFSAFGVVEITDTTISGNVASLGGGFFRSQRGKTTVTNSTFSGNEAEFGGGIVNLPNEGEPPALTLTNSTFFGNGASFWGGGIFNEGGTVEATNTTLSGNEAEEGGGIFYRRGTATLRNTIVANSPSGGNCSTESVGTITEITDGGYNIDDGTTCDFSEATGSLSNTNPLLDPAGLQDNGGPTPTIALLPDSPAVDLVGEEACPPPETDQRGVERPQGEACDSGAFELVQEPPQPQTKADCKKGGYKEFGFKNQGRCIAFVNKAAQGQ
jgi:hypothetical protein